ncbi:MAG: hypothetical protein J7L61_03990, partial [Thermoplasmata archaeon]|nr:hypothetical protein [Thermoplasmata archaeon]
GGLDIGAMNEAGGFMVGYHDFSPFSRVESHRDPRRRIYRVTVSEHSWEGISALAIDVRGESFLWNMVRRMAAALLEVGRGSMEPEDIRELLDGGKNGVSAGPGGPETRLPPSLPPEGLILMDVDYGLPFEPLETDIIPRESSAARKWMKIWTEMRMEYWRRYAVLGLLQDERAAGGSPG